MYKCSLLIDKNNKKKKTPKKTGNTYNKLKFTKVWVWDRFVGMAKLGQHGSTNLRYVYVFRIY